MSWRGTRDVIGTRTVLALCIALPACRSAPQGKPRAMVVAATNRPPASLPALSQADAHGTAPTEARDTDVRDAGAASAGSGDDWSDLVVAGEGGAIALRRSALLKLQQEGPQRFLQLVRVRPIFARRRFFAWRIEAYRGPGALNPGDAVRRINGRTLERPEDFFEVWQQLGERSELVVELLRERRLLVLRYPIVERPAGR